MTSDHMGHQLIQGLVSVWTRLNNRDFLLRDGCSVYSGWVVDYSYCSWTWCKRRKGQTHDVLFKSLRFQATKQITCDERLSQRWGSPPRQYQRLLGFVCNREIKAMRFNQCKVKSSTFSTGLWIKSISQFLSGVVVNHFCPVGCEAEIMS